MPNAKRFGRLQPHWLLSVGSRLEEILLGDAAAAQLHGMGHGFGYLVGRLLIAEGDAIRLAGDVLLYRCLLTLRTGSMTRKNGI